MRRTFLQVAAGFALTRILGAQGPPPIPGADIVIDIRNGDQKGKLLIKSDELAFESLSDARHSRHWKYQEIREFAKKGGKEMRVQPFKGDRYDFQFKDKKECDRIYQEISNRVVAARNQPK